MVQSPSWEANWFAASQEIPCISRNPKVHYRTHKRPPPVSILGQPNPAHIPTSHLLEIHPNINHPSTPRSPHWSLSLRFRPATTIVSAVYNLSTTCFGHCCCGHHQVGYNLSEKIYRYGTTTDKKYCTVGPNTDPGLTHSTGYEPTRHVHYIVIDKQGNTCYMHGS